MKIQQHDRERARTIAQHEMGHYVLSRAMGFGTGEVNLELTGHNGHKGGAVIILAQPLTGLDAVRSFLERRILVLYAGALAETLTPSHTPESGVNNIKAVGIIQGALGAEQDHAKAREAVALLRNILHPETRDEAEILSQLQAIDLRLWNRATELVERFERTIVGVAGALTETLKFTGVQGKLRAALSAEVLAGIPALQDIPQLEP